MKKGIALLIGIILLITCSMTVFADRIDDGSLSVATKDDIKYFGAEVFDGCIKYIAADGSDNIFYDLTGDKDMNICDLVKLVKEQVDFDCDDTYDSDDAAALRMMLIY